MDTQTFETDPVTVTLADADIAPVMTGTPGVRVNKTISWASIKTLLAAIFALRGAAAPENNVYDVFRVDSTTAASAWVGKIASLPGGADLTYTTTSGAAAAMVPSATGQLAKMRLYNTTRGNYGLIFNCVIGVAKITLTANVPVGWQVNDVIKITSPTVSGGGYSWVDLEIVSGPIGKTALFAALIIGSAAANDALCIHPTEAYGGGKILTVAVQVAGVNFYGFGLFSLTANVFSLAWVGAPTVVVIREMGYL